MARTTVGKINLASLEGLLIMKIATLVSRCSEKDLYDLIWLFDNYRTPVVDEFAILGGMIDMGVSEESILISLSCAQLRESACHFAEEAGVGAAVVFKKINSFKENLIRQYSTYLRQKPENYELKNLLDKLKN
jgi:hypothetical protein